jgi:hypothetical protein
MFGIHADSPVNHAMETLKINPETLAAVQKGLKQVDTAMRSTVRERPYHVAAGILAAGIVLGALVPFFVLRRN